MRKGGKDKRKHGWVWTLAGYKTIWENFLRNKVYYNYFYCCWGVGDWFDWLLLLQINLVFMAWW